MQAIDWGSPRIRVTSSHGVLECRAVVVTVPTTLLARGEPKFSPVRPDIYEEAFTGLTLGVANKVFVDLDPAAIPFAETTHIVASVTTTRTISVTVRPAGQPVLLAFFGGRYARELETAGMLESVARDELIGLFGSDLGRRIRKTTATAWASDPWSRGSYSAARPGFARCRTVLTEPVAGRVFFAGEACTPTAYGAIHGAWLSAVAAADRVLASLRGVSGPLRRDRLRDSPPAEAFRDLREGESR